MAVVEKKRAVRRSGWRSDDDDDEAGAARWSDDRRAECASRVSMQWGRWWSSRCAAGVCGRRRRRTSGRSRALWGGSADAAAPNPGASRPILRAQKASAHDALSRSSRSAAARTDPLAPRPPPPSSRSTRPRAQGEHTQRWHSKDTPIERGWNERGAGWRERERENTTQAHKPERQPPPPPPLPHARPPPRPVPTRRARSLALGLARLGRRLGLAHRVEVGVPGRVEQLLGCCALLVVVPQQVVEEVDRLVALREEERQPGVRRARSGDEGDEGEERRRTM